TGGSGAARRSLCRSRERPAPDRALDLLEEDAPVTLSGDPATTRDNEELVGRKALVTGATKGIGEAVALRLREAGATVLTTARTQGAANADSFVAADLGTAAGCEVVADAVLRRFGGVDVVVHVVGGSSAPAGGFAVLGDTEWQRGPHLNLRPAVPLA